MLLVLFPVFGRCIIKDFNPFGKIYLFHVISCAYYIPTNATCPHTSGTAASEEKASFGCESRQSCREIHATGSNPIPSMGLVYLPLVTYIGWIHCGKCRCIYTLYAIHGSYGNCQFFFQKFCSLLRFWYRRKERPRAGVRKNTLVGVD